MTANDRTQRCHVPHLFLFFAMGMPNKANDPSGSKVPLAVISKKCTLVKVLLGIVPFFLLALQESPPPLLSTVQIKCESPSCEKSGPLKEFPLLDSTLSYCLADANSVALIYHFFVLSLGALGGLDPFTQEPIWKPGRSGKVYAPWLSEKGTVDRGNGLWAPVSSLHNETTALLAPDFRLIAEEPVDGCVPLGQTHLLADDHPEPYAHRFLARFFKAAVTRLTGWPAFDPSLKVYIPRRTFVGPKRREVLNEPELVAQLVPLGFVIVPLETLNVTEKIRLFARARMILSTQSAGLLFSSFMDRRAVCVEIYPDNGLFRHYDWMTKDVGVPYRRYGRNLKTDGGSPMLLNMRIDPSDFQEYVVGLLKETEGRAQLPEQPPFETQH